MNTQAGARPRNVVIAVIILGVTLLYGSAISMYLFASGKLDKPIPQSPLDPETMHFLMISMAVMSVLFFFLFAFFLYKIYRGRNWARIVYLVFFLFGVLTSIPGYVKLFHAPQTLAYPPAMGYVGLVGEVAKLVAMALLFFGTGATWFKRVSAQPG